MRVNEYIKYFNYRALTCYRQNQSFGTVRKKVFLKISQNLQENTCISHVSILKVFDLNIPKKLIKEYIVFNFIAYIRCETTRFFSGMHKNKLQQMVEN